MNTILEYAQRNKSSFEMGGVSSNEIRFFTYEGKRYILKTPLMTRDDFSPFWTMMRKVFGYSVKEQNSSLHNIYNTLKDNPHIKVAPFVAANEDASVLSLLKEQHGIMIFFQRERKTLILWGSLLDIITGQSTIIPDFWAFQKEIYFLRMPEDILKIVLASIGVGMMMQIKRSGVVTSR